MGISVFIITYNEEKKIGRTLDALRWADEIIVVDSGSRDKTVDLCVRAGAHVFTRAFDNFSAQKNYALSLVSNSWALSLDADEVPSPELTQEIKNVCEDRKSDSIAGYWINRRNYFFGKPLRFGRQGTEAILRLFQKPLGRYYGAVHETLQVEGKTERLSGTLHHWSTESLKEYFSKFPLYTNLEAERLIAEKRVPTLVQALIYPPLIWVRDYVFFAGFLDGYAGFLYHGLSCWYRWVKNMKARRGLND